MQSFFVLLFILDDIRASLRLEYKYHKLIQNSSDRSGELPGAPQCVGDDDDDEEEVRIHKDSLLDMWG